MQQLEPWAERWQLWPALLACGCFTWALGSHKLFNFCASPSLSSALCHWAPGAPLAHLSPCPSETSADPSLPRTTLQTCCFRRAGQDWSWSWGRQANISSPDSCSLIFQKHFTVGRGKGLLSKRDDSALKGFLIRKRAGSEPTGAEVLIQSESFPSSLMLKHLKSFL